MRWSDSFYSFSKIRKERNDCWNYWNRFFEKFYFKGGLGHLGVKYSAAMGYNTVAVTTDVNKV